MLKSRCIVTTLLLAALVLPGLARAAEADAPATPERVDQAIERAKAWLYSKQVDGNWDNEPPPQQDQRGGMTAFVVYALLAMGESPQDERLKPAIDWMLKNDTDGTYAISLRCQVWNLLPTSEPVRAALRKDATKLLFTIGKERTEKVRGFYSYTFNNQSNADPSCSQYGALGMWAATQAGFEAPPAYWDQVDKQWRKLQEPGGGWSYQGEPGDDGTIRASMTCAGIATLYIAQDQLNAGKPVQCKGNLTDPDVDRATKWMSDHWEKAINKGGYGLYAIERMGLATGRKFIGTHNWYEEGSDRILKGQAANGSFPNQVPWLAETCFDTLFLVRGRAPIVMSKLEYSLTNKGESPKVAPWNQRPRDVANAVQWLSKQTERHLNWQITNLNSPVDELLDAPILYIAGNQPLKLTDPEIARLKAYVEAGGLILGNADCANDLFAASFRSLGAKMFNYEFRNLPESNVLYTGQMFPRAKWKTKPVIQGMSNGARELMVLLPSLDASKGWCMNTAKSQDASLSLIADLFQYTTKQQDLRRRPPSPWIARDDSVKAKTTARIARLEYNGNWDPEPGGWRRLANFMHNRESTDLDIAAVKLGTGKLDQTFQVAHLTGTTNFSLDEASRNELRAFVNNRGTLIIDAAGGAGEFNVAVTKELDAIFGKDAAQLKTLPADHALYQDLKGPIAYRAFARTALSGPNNVPRQRGIELNGRVAVIYSAEDLSVGLVGQSVDGIIGYDPATATELMARVIQFTRSHKGGASSQKS